MKINSLKEAFEIFTNVAETDEMRKEAAQYLMSNGMSEQDIRILEQEEGLEPFDFVVKNTQNIDYDDINIAEHVPPKNSKKQNASKPKVQKEKVQKEKVVKERTVFEKEQLGTVQSKVINSPDFQYKGLRVGDLVVCEPRVNGSNIVAKMTINNFKFDRGVLYAEGVFEYEGEFRKTGKAVRGLVQDTRNANVVRNTNEFPDTDLTGVYAATLTEKVGRGRKTSGVKVDSISLENESGVQLSLEDEVESI